MTNVDHLFMSLFGICISYVMKCVFTFMFKHFYWGTVDRINCSYLKSFASWSLLLPRLYTTATLPYTIICFPTRGWSIPPECYEFIGGTLIPMAPSQGSVRLRSLCPHTPFSYPPGGRKAMLIRGRGVGWPGPEQEGGCGDQGDLAAGLTQDLSLLAALQVTGQRPQPVPVQCHSAPPGPFLLAVWEGPARGSPSVWVKGWCGPPLPIRHTCLCLAFRFIRRTFWRGVLNFDQVQLNSCVVLFCFVFNGSYFLFPKKFLLNPR